MSLGDCEGSADCFHPCTSLCACASGAAGMEIWRLCGWEGQDSPSAQDLQSPDREGTVCRCEGDLCYMKRPKDWGFWAQSLFPISVPVLQEKEIYRWPIRESLKSMLAMGWSVDRTKDGESMSQQRENEKMRKISQTSQVRYSAEIQRRHYQTVINVL